MIDATITYGHTVPLPNTLERFRLFPAHTRFNFAHERISPVCCVPQGFKLLSDLLLIGCRLQTVGSVPPSMTHSVPVIDEARDEAKNAMRSATSSGLAGRPSGIPPRLFMMICFPPS